MTPQATIEKLSECSEHSDRVLGWLQSTWEDPNGVFADTLAPTSVCPGALVAIDDRVPCGVLTFRRYRAAGHAAVELWINALYVVPSYRRRGIGRDLIRSAVSHGIPAYAERLFVFTEFPDLYERLGWKRIGYDVDSGSTTLHFEGDAEPKSKVAPCATDRRHT